MPRIELKTLDGKTLSLPKDTNGKLTLLAFVEPPEVVRTESELDARGRPKTKNPNSIMERAHNLADRHIHKELNVVAAFLCDDPKKIETMMKVEERKKHAPVHRQAPEQRPDHQTLQTDRTIPGCFIAGVRACR